MYLFFPIYCAACDQPLYQNEKVICTSCRHLLPLGNFHKGNAKKIEKVFYGRVKIENATALLRFQKEGLVQKMIHNLKYKGYKKVSIELGQWLGEELKEITVYKEVDYIIPVPLHPKRLRERGYNQVEGFGKALAQKLNAKYEDQILKKKSYNRKQSQKGKFDRWENTFDTFAIQNQSLLIDKHILLVDDVLTTGATLEACATTLIAIKGIKISIATMAIAE